MLVAGYHAQNDMAGKEDDSWLKILKKNGFNVEIHMHGIGEYKFIQDKFVRHLLEEIEKYR